MRQNEAQGTDLEELRRRVDDLEATVEQQETTMLWLNALFEREQDTNRRDRGPRSDPPCCNCEDGVLHRERDRLVCTSCEYVRHL